MMVPQRIKLSYHMDPSIPLMGIYLRRGTKKTQLETYVHPHVHASITIAKDTAQPECPSVHEWIKCCT